MIVVVDASVAVKWFVDEADHDAAKQVLVAGVVRLAPDLVLSEVAGALGRKVQLAEFAIEQGRIVVAELPGYFSLLVDADYAITELFEIACKLLHPIADCIYLAVAKKSGGLLVTADDRFLGKLKGTEFEPLAVHISDWVLRVAPPLISSGTLAPGIFGNLIRLSDRFQDTKVSLGKDWRDEQVANLMEIRLADELQKLDELSLANLIAACWFGSQSHVDDTEQDRKNAWRRHLSNALDFVREKPLQTAYLTSKLQFLELGLALLSQTGSEPGHD